MIKIYKLSNEQVSSIREGYTNSFSRISDHLIMNGLAAVIAACGLMQDNVAVIIGAMLIATLMTPLGAIGFGAAAGEWHVFRRGLATLAKSIGVVFVLSLIIGFFLNTGISGEMMVRTDPTTLDVIIALAGGAAATWVTVMPRMAGALVGAAIATALVPPLVTCGLFLAQMQTFYALGAFLLFAVNLSAIAVSSMGVYMLVGLRRGIDAGANRGAGYLRWLLLGILVIVVIAILYGPALMDGSSYF